VHDVRATPPVCLVLPLDWRELHVSSSPFFFFAGILFLISRINYVTNLSSLSWFVLSHSCDLFLLFYFICYHVYMQDEDFQVFALLWDQAVWKIAATSTKVKKGTSSYCLINDFLASNFDVKYGVFSIFVYVRNAYKL
jgi:hypothetical protein